MFYYRHEDKILASKYEYENLKRITGDEAEREGGILYMLNRLDPKRSRRLFTVSHPSLLSVKEENLKLLREKQFSADGIPDWILSKINLRQVLSLNTMYPSWEDELKHQYPAGKWRINIAGLGDVGGTLLVGLILLGGEYISSIGLYDKDRNKIQRWLSEGGQICAPFWDRQFPSIHEADFDNIFDCDMFVFCVTAGVPPLGKEDRDVRMAQFEGNSKIIKLYAQKARECNFKGLFSVVSDPVDQLCKTVLNESNMASSSEMGFSGLCPEQIRGYGLGVMNGRASFYASREEESAHYINEGRAFGPHGEGLVIADSIENYDDKLSVELTQKAKNANIEIRSLGYKPYVAPAISSGSIPIISTISGMWHYSSVPLGGIFMGCKNRLINSGTEIEMLNIPDRLWDRLEKTYRRLGEI